MVEVSRIFMAAALLIAVMPSLAVAVTGDIDLPIDQDNPTTNPQTDAGTVFDQNHDDLPPIPADIENTQSNNKLDLNPILESHPAKRVHKKFKKHIEPDGYIRSFRSTTIIPLAHSDVDTTRISDGFSDLFIEDFTLPQRPGFRLFDQSIDVDTIKPETEFKQIKNNTSKPAFSDEYRFIQIVD